MTTFRQQIEELSADGAVNLHRWLELIRGTGVAEFRSWTSYEMPRNVFRIVSRPQSAVAFFPERLVIPRDAASRWIVHEFTIGNRSQFPRSGIMPIRADEITADTLDFEPVQTNMEVGIEVEYIGDNEAGEVFYASLLGREGSRDGSGQAMTLSSAPGRIQARGGRGVLLELEGFMFRFDERAGRIERVRAYEATTTVMDGVMRQILDHGGHSLDSVRGRPSNPVMVSLHVQPLNMGYMLFGIDERLGSAIFEVGDFSPIHAQNPQSFHARCELTGYQPTWWEHARDINAEPELDV